MTTSRNTCFADARLIKSYAKIVDNPDTFLYCLMELSASGIIHSFINKKEEQRSVRATRSLPEFIEP